MSSPERALARPRGRPPVIASERLLAIAREVFLEQGIRATTAEVALRAGVSEGTVFHRFGTKEVLFRRAMNFDPHVEPAVLASLPRIVGRGDLRQNLVRFGVQLLELGSVALPVMMMAWSNPASEFSFARLAERGPGGRTRPIDAVKRFLAAEQKLGRISSDADVDVLGRMFVGTLHHRCLEQILFTRGMVAASTHVAFVRSVVGVLLDSVTPRAKRATRTKKGKV